MKRIATRYWLLSSIAILIMTSGPSLAHQEHFEKMGVALPKKEKIAPDFKLKNLVGDTVALNNFQGKTVLLNFWATWCLPCKEELPSMQRLYKKLGFLGVEVVAVSIDRDNPDKVKKYIDQYNLTFPILLDPRQEARKSYFIMGLPTSYLIGADGRLKGFISGAREWDSPASIRMFSALTN